MAGYQWAFLPVDAASEAQAQAQAQNVVGGRDQAPGREAGAATARGWPVLVKAGATMEQEMGNRASDSMEMGMGTEIPSLGREGDASARWPAGWAPGPQALREMEEVRRLLHPDAKGKEEEDEGVDDPDRRRRHDDLEAKGINASLLALVADL